MAKKTNIADLESSLSKISQLIEKMERGELTLEQALNHFEQGINLIKNCQTILQEAEQKVQILIQNSSQTELPGEELKPYNVEDNPE